MLNAFVNIFGWPATILQRDPTVFDRWIWFRHHLLTGPQRTLDVGCGAGEFTLYAALVGNRAIGLSFDENLNSIARTRADLLKIASVSFIKTDIRALDGLSEQLGVFDQIVCLETIEHILNDRKLVADLARLMKPNGQLLLTTPFKYRRRSPFDQISEIEDGGHVRWGYTFPEIRTLFNEVGLNVKSEEYVTGFVSQKIIHLMWRIGRYRLAWLTTFPFRLFQLIDRPLTNFIRYPWFCIAVVGVKCG